jgi:hypothetical protein
MVIAFIRFLRLRFFSNARPAVHKKSISQFCVSFCQHRITLPAIPQELLWGDREIDFAGRFMENKVVKAPVAQRIRASASGAEGRRFESSQARQTSYLVGYGSGQNSFLRIAQRELTGNASFCFTIELNFQFPSPSVGR